MLDYAAIEKCLRDCVTSFLIIFFIKNLYPGPIWTGKNCFRKCFVFAKIFSKNVCPRSRWRLYNILHLLLSPVITEPPCTDFQAIQESACQNHSTLIPIFLKDSCQLKKRLRERLLHHLKDTLHSYHKLSKSLSALISPAIQETPCTHITSYTRDPLHSYHQLSKRTPCTPLASYPRDPQHSYHKLSKSLPALISPVIQETSCTPLTSNPRDPLHSYHQLSKRPPALLSPAILETRCTPFTSYSGDPLHSYHQLS